jgi:hypothetical protein
MIQYSQRDPRWAKDRLGFAQEGQTIESYGCLVTACAMVLTYHGFAVNPQELNKKLQNAGGFTGALMYFNVLPNLFPVRVNLINCGRDNPAPLQLINASLDSGRPVIVEVDASPRTGFQNHWVTIYKRDGGKYLISDPWSYLPENETLALQDRYGFAGRPEQIITNVFQIEPVHSASVPAATPASDSKPAPEISAVPSGRKVRVLIDGLRLRNGASTNATELTRLNTGMELVSAGDPVKDGAITWQPVLLYVAANNGNDLYIEAVK